MSRPAIGLACLVVSLLAAGAALADPPPSTPPTTMDSTVNSTVSLGSLFDTPAASSVMQVADAGAPPPTAATYQGTTDGVGGYFADWFRRVDIAQATQPHWMTPIVTITPRLEEEMRYDQYWEKLPNGARVINYDTGKGLELIPTTTNEVIIGLPPYIDRGIKTPASGLGDWPFLLIKQRLLSANEQEGNYILTLFLQGIAPTGVPTFTTNAYYVVPTIAGGIGFGDFDMQATISTPYPLSHIDTLGAQLATNVTFQYHLLDKLWPEFEVNDTVWLSGSQRAGKDQIFLTPGIIFGRFPINGRVRLIAGVGYQFAVTPHTELNPVTPLYNHNWILTTRLAF